MGVLRGDRPDLTPAQLAGGVPVLANLANAFGVFTLSAPQTDSLQMTILYGLALVGGDAAVRFGRNLKDAKVEAAGLAGAARVPPAT